LSICVTVKNRSRVAVDGRDLLLFPRCVESVKKAVDRRFACELIVADWESDDWSYDDWLEKTASPVPVRIVPLTGTFSRGHGLNSAAAAARGETLLFLDADCLISAEMVDAGLKYAEGGKAFFPIMFSFSDPD